MDVAPYLLIPGDRVAVADGDIRIVAAVNAVHPRNYHKPTAKSTVQFTDGSRVRVPGVATLRLAE